jgi:hypothetical protein
MEGENRGGLEDDGGTHEAGRAHESGAESRDDTVRRLQIRCAFSGTVHDQQLLFEQQRFSNDCPKPTRPDQAGQRDDQVDEEDGQVAHDPTSVAISVCLTSLGFFGDLR